MLLLGLEKVAAGSWAVLAEAGVLVERVGDVAASLEVLKERPASVVIVDASRARELTNALRADPDLALTHVVAAAALDTPGELREGLDAGADDVIRVPFEPEVLAARVEAGFRAAQLRSSEAMLRSLVTNIPGAVYRCACDSDWTMEWLSEEIETISGYPAHEFIQSRTRTFASVIHPDDRAEVERLVLEGVAAQRPFTLEYRIERADGEVRWVLERGQAQDAGDGRRWLDGAIFDITARRAAEQALREREVMGAQLAEVRASRARIVHAADRARYEIERNLHDGAQQRFVALSMALGLIETKLPGDPEGACELLATARADLAEGLAELREIARGLHPAVLTERGLDAALEALTARCPVPVALDVPTERLPEKVEATAYFVVAEALTNVARYSGASRASVEITRANGTLELAVSDDGVGGAEPAAGSGLRGLADRVAAVGGRLSVHSPRGEGTTIQAEIPCG